MEKPAWISHSWAKINLGLQVLNRLPTGYHQISTGFVFINWKDRFEVSPCDSLRLTTTDAKLPTDERNLVIRAVNRFRKYTGVSTQLDIHLDKLIPFGAGLGGGSSNAATILRMINKMSETNLPHSELSRISAELGADIPLFIHGKTGIGEDTGINITFENIQPDYWIVTVFPEIHVSTAEAFFNCQPEPEPEFSLRQVLLHEPVEEWKYVLTNDLEPWAISQYPMIGHLKDQMYELGASYSSMSGSGSSVFGLFEQEFVAIDAYNRFMDWKFKTNITPPDFKADFGIYRKS